MAAVRSPRLSALYALFRRVDFRGKGRLRDRIPPPEAGTVVASFPGGFRLELDLRESLQRDFYFGLYDRPELALVRRALARGGDAIDAGAHVGMYAVAMAAALGGRGRVLALEPNPAARRQLERNVALNRLGVIVRAAGAADARGRAELLVPATHDPSFSSLQRREFDTGERLEIELTTIDDECARLGLVPAVLKIDVEGSELRVLDGAASTLDVLPLVMCEVGPDSAAEIERRLGERGYVGYRIEAGRPVRGVAAGSGWFNAVFVPPEGPLTTILP